MPRYDFRCEAGHKFELQLPFGSSSEQPCERCGKSAHRQLVAPPLVFKSGGFYKTSGRSDSSSSGGDGTKGVRSKTPPSKSSDSSSSDSSSSSSSSTTASTSSDD